MVNRYRKGRIAEGKIVGDLRGELPAAEAGEGSLGLHPKLFEKIETATSVK